MEEDFEGLLLKYTAALKTLERPIGRNNVVMNKKINRQDLDNIVNDLGVKEK